MLSGRRYRSRSIDGAVYQWLNSIPRADYFAALRYLGYRDLKSVFLLKENILKE